MRRALRSTPGRGIDRLLDAAAVHLAELAGWPALLRFLSAEPQVAHRVLLPPGAVHDRSVALWRDLLEQGAETGELDLPFPRPTPRCWSSR